MAIDWKTLLFELLNFAVLMFVLGRYLFRPVRAVMVKRREEIEAAQRALAEAHAEADAARRALEVRRGELEAGAQASAAEVLARAEKAGAAALAEARDDAKRATDAAAAEVDALRRRALVELRPGLVRLAADAAAALLRDAAAPDLAVAFARRAAEALADAVPARPFPPVRAWLSPDADEATILRALRAVLGPGAALEVHRDPALVAGVRLAAAGVEIDASASASLARWLAEHDAHEAHAAHTEESAA